MTVPGDGGDGDAARAAPASEEAGADASRSDADGGLAVIAAQDACPEDPADADPDAEAARSLAALDRTLGATLDAGLRLRQVAALAERTPPDTFATVIERAARACANGGPREAWVAIAHWVLHARPRPRFPVGHWPIPDDRLMPAGAEIALAIARARDRQQAFAEALLRGAFAAPVADDARLLPLHPSVEKWSLGWRRERARSADAQQLQFLLLDTTPAVVQILADNPRTLETHAVQVASLRPQHPWALQSLLLPLRWLASPRVAEAVARNASAPGWLVLLLAPLLPRRTQMALVHLTWIDGEARDILAGWHGVAIAKLADRAPGDAFTVDGDDGDLGDWIAGWDGGGDRNS